MFKRIDGNAKKYKIYNRTGRGKQIPAQFTSLFSPLRSE
jgi:hypothetical protein